MPMMLYFCGSCGYQFQKLVGTPTPQEVLCKDSKCGQSARIRPTSGARVTSSATPSGPSPQNTGLSHLDHDVDRVIALDADAKIREMQNRQREKRAFMEREGVGGHQLSRLSDGEYFVITDEQRRAAKRARVLHMEALDKKPPDFSVPWPDDFRRRDPK